MRRSAAIVIVLSTLLGTSVSTKQTIEFSEEFALRPARLRLKWPKPTIEIAFSSSLKFPGPNFKLGSDVMGAARRALSRWAGLANVTFVETSSTRQSISSAGGDGISLITVADTPDNNAIFGAGGMTGRTRVFYDPETGEISEADVCINPHPTLVDGTPIEFSTDGTLGTYDLESTFTHEIGHLLGLDHSSVLAATMQARQGVNGVYGLPAFTGRTLSEHDRERVRALYGPHDGTGAVEGSLLGKFSGSYVWAENAISGCVAGGAVVSDEGTFQIGSLIPGPYRILVERFGSPASVPDKTSAIEAAMVQLPRLLRAAELANQVVVKPDATSLVGTSFVPPGPSQTLSPRFVGIAGELSTLAVPLEAGKTFTVLLAGEGVDQVPGLGISVGSPFFTVDPASLRREQFGTSFPVVSITISVAANVPFGDYSIRLQSNSGEVAYLAGGITIDPGVDSIETNPTDDPRFLVTQHYRDFLGREPDREGLNFWVGQLDQCGADIACIHSRRLAVSSAFASGPEFQSTGSFVYGLYKAGLGRAPRLLEFTADRSLIHGGGKEFEAARQALARDFVGRREFVEKYPTETKGEKFVDALLTDISRNSAVELFSQRESLVALYDQTESGRAAIVSRIVSMPAFEQAEFNRAFVLLQYFAYLRRDPDEDGYNFWLKTLQTKPARNPELLRGMICSFLNSPEYQNRFGMVVTHTHDECR